MGHSVKLLGGVLLLLAVVLTERYLSRPCQPSAKRFLNMVENPDGVPFLDEHLLRG